MTDPIRDALQRLIEAVVSGTIPDIRNAINGARAALAEPVAEPPAPPAEGEVAELVNYLRGIKSLHCQRAAELLERAMAGDATAARQFLHEAGFTDASGNWLPHYQPLQETND